MVNQYFAPRQRRRIRPAIHRGYQARCPYQARPDGQSVDGWPIAKISTLAKLAKLAQETGLEITVSHYPPGTSKWNHIVIYTGIPGVYEVTNEPAPVPEVLARARLSASRL